MNKKVLTTIALISLSACVNAANHSAELHSNQDREFTLGIVQREIRTGMSQEAVATALGSPNIVSEDASGYETWIYDKIAQEASYSNSSGTAGGLLGAGGPVGSVLLLGLGGGSYEKNAGASASTQRTLTVVVKFDDHGRVSKATYHSSRF